MKYFLIMPTIFTIDGYRFYFYSNEHTSVHVHIAKGGAEAKYQVTPLAKVYNHGFTPAEIKAIEGLIQENAEGVINHWNRYFNKSK